METNSYIEVSPVVRSWHHSGIIYSLHEDMLVTDNIKVGQGALKQLDHTKNSFLANGKIYLIERELSIDRWVKQQEMEIELGFGMTYQELKNNMVKIYNLTNKDGGMLGEIARVSYNSATGISKALERTPQILKFCSLFLNTPDEDRSTITDSQIEAKIADFSKEGYAIDGFFVFALSLITDLAEDYRKVTANVLKQAGNLLEGTQESN